jgi:hypothetical protein
MLTADLSTFFGLYTTVDAFGRVYEVEASSTCYHCPASSAQIAFIISKFYTRYEPLLSIERKEIVNNDDYFGSREQTHKRS